MDVLSQAKEPLHWSVIVEKSYNLGRRKSFSSAGIYNTLLRYPKEFVRIGPGTYALVEWGLTEIDYYPDIIASVLSDEQKPLNVDNLFVRVNSSRPIKRTTLQMYLDMHPRFYKSIDGTYGLRCWLLPKENQTLRTPEYLIEDMSSFVRIERAIARGYDVDSIVTADKSHHPLKPQSKNS